MTKLSLCLASGLLFLPMVGKAQVSNGVFDPSKVMVAKDRAKELEAFKQNIDVAREINRTIGTPSHPRPHLSPPPGTIAVAPNLPVGPAPREPVVKAAKLPPPLPDSTELKPASVMAKKLVDRPPVETVEVPQFDNPGVNLPPSPPGGARAGYLAPRTLPSPVASDSPVTESGLGLTSADRPPEDGGDMNPEMPVVRKTSWFDRLSGKSRNPSIPAPVNMTLPETEVAAADTPPDSEKKTPAPTGPISNDQQTISELSKRIEELEKLLAEKDGHFHGGGSLIDGIMLPSHDDPVGTIDTSRKKLFAKRSSRTHDMTEKRIPITVYSNEGNPYSSDRFQAGPRYSPLFDTAPTQPNPDQARDMTKPGSVPLPSRSVTEMVSRSPEKPLTDTTQYWVVKKDGVAFQPFKFGTEEVEENYSLDLYTGAIVREFGLVGTKRVVQIDSGEKGLVLKEGIRNLSVSEETVMTQGLQAGRPWYSILDTAAER